MKVANYRQVEAEEAAEAVGVTVRVVIGEEDGAPNFVMRVFDVEPGAATPLHTHYWEHEVFVLGGRGRVHGGGEEGPLGEGDIVFIPPMEEHRFVNEGDEPLRFICVIPLLEKEYEG
jgi:quercetin dioxygenase-like cupin family protein